MLFAESLLAAESHIDTLIIYKLSSRKFTTQNDLYQYTKSIRVVISKETNVINYKCLHMRWQVLFVESLLAAATVLAALLRLRRAAWPAALREVR